jgi:hypothetical protein
MTVKLAPEVRQAIDRMDMKSTLVMMGFMLDHALNLHLAGDEQDKPKSRLLVPGR